MENETVDRKALGNSLLESLREDGYREANIVYQQTLALLSECSRLASRVEELENLIAKQSGSLSSADSASNTKSARTAKETR